MKVVVIKKMSAGNDTVGEMWDETKIFDSNEPIENILRWVQTNFRDYTRKQVIITVPHNAGQ